MDKYQRTSALLPRTLSSLQTWGFGLTGHVGWIGTAPVIHAALGPKAILVWLPGVVISVLLNLQVQHLGKHWQDIAGGTPNYAARLLRKYPNLGRYVAIAYFFSWAAAPAIYAIILTELIKVNLAPLGISCPETLLKIGFTAIAFIVAFSGSRALAILHLFFLIPAITFVLAFCLQGTGWIAFKAIAPPSLSTIWDLSFSEWAKWFFIATYSVYACETAASFVGDSQRPEKTLQFLTVAAWLIPLVFLGGSWVLISLAPNLTIDDTFLNLFQAALPFWGNAASFLITLLISFSCLLSCATAVANSPRILYQLSLDKQLAPVFAVVSPQGVLAPALAFTLLISLLCLAWGDLTQIVLIAGTSYLISIMGLHLGMWLRRGAKEARFAHLSLVFLVLEAVVFFIGGLAWGWYDLLGGLLFPAVILACDAAIRRLSLPIFQPQWWLGRRSNPWASKFKDVVALQAVVLIALVCSATTIGWFISSTLNNSLNEKRINLLIILLVTLSFVAMAIACWTTLPQIAAIDKARLEAKNLLTAALDTIPDTILVLAESGMIRQINPAAEELFQTDAQHLIGKKLNDFLPNLATQPQQWANRSEQILKLNARSHILEVTLSQPSPQQFPEYVAILRDITERKQSEESLRSSLTINRALLNAIPDVIFRIRADGMIVSFKAPKNYFSVPVSRSVGKNIKEVLPPDVAHSALNCVKQAFSTNEVQIFEYQLVLDSKPHDYEARVITVTDSEVMAIVRNITQRKQAEADMRHALAKEKELSLLKSRFVTMTSHEFRTPLTTILSSAELIEKYGFKWTQEKKQQHLLRIQAAVKQMTQLLNDVLLIGKAEAGKLEFKPTPLDLTEFCKGLVDEIQISNRDRQIIFENRFTYPNAYLDEKLLRHILSNLLSNAVKYSPQGSMVKFDLSQEQQIITFRVRDTGIGIPTTDLANLFDSFHRASNVGTISGTGLGLAIVKKSVDLHGGKIAVESEVGVGTTFTVHLPFNPAI